MPNYISAQIFKKKALDRWENEGGMFFADRTETSKSDTSSERAEIRNIDRAVIKKSDRGQIKKLKRI